MHKSIFLSLLLVSSAAFAQSPPPNIPGLSVSPASIDFDDTEIHTGTFGQSITITNTGTSPIAILNLNVDPSFVFNWSPCDTLAPNETCNVDTAFGPESLGRKRSTLIVHSSIGDVGVALSGFGSLPSTGDSVANAVIMPATFAETVTTRTATADVDDPRPIACEPGTDSRTQTVWYRFHPMMNGWLQVDTRGSDFNTLVSVWSGSPGAFTLNACDDDEEIDTKTSQLALPVSSANDYYIMVAGSTSADTGILNFSSVFQTDQELKQQEVTTSSVTPGQSSTFKVIAQFDGDTNLSVSVSPATPTISCSATPKQLQFYGAGGSRYSTVNVKCTTAGPNASLTPTPPPSPHNNWHQLLLAGTCLAIFFAGVNRRSRGRTASIALLAAVMVLGSCGGGAGSNATAPASPPSTSSSTGSSSGLTTGSTGGGTPGGNPSTAPGTYTLSLTGSPKQVVSSQMTLAVR